MTGDDKTTGLVPYSGPSADRVRDALTLLRRKAELRAMLHDLHEQLALALSGLDREQTQALFALMDKETATGPEIEQVREEAEQAAQGIRPCDVRLTRQAASALRAEAIRRLSAGRPCPATPLLASQAILAQFERR
jgi:hypothetical protein